MQGRPSPPNFRQHVVGLGDPAEHPRAAIVVSDVLLDRRDQFPYVAEDAAPQPTGRQVAEPPLNEVEPRTAGRDEVQMEPGMACEPP